MPIPDPNSRAGAARRAAPWARVTLLGLFLAALVAPLLTTPVFGALPAQAAPAQTAPAPRAAPAPEAEPTADAGPAAPVVVVGMTGLRWDDVSLLGTPALWSLSREASVGLVAARGVTTSACPADAWLTVSAGTRAADARVPDRSCRTLRDPGADGAVPGWSDYVTAVGQQQYGARPGLLGDALATAGTGVVGIGPGAAVALADGNGQVIGTHVTRPTDAAGWRTAVREALGTANLVVVDAGQVREPGHATEPRYSATDEPFPTDPAELDPPVTEPPADVAIVDPTRASQVRAIDDRLDAVLTAVGERPATVLVVSIGDSGRPTLQLVAAVGPDGTGGTFGESLVTSGSTRRAGLVQTVDVTPTVLGLLGLDRSSPLLSGAPVRTSPGPASATARIDSLRDTASEAYQATRVSGGFTTRLVLADAVLFAVAAFVLTRIGRGDRLPMRPVLRGLQVVALALAAAPVASFLAGTVPWWRGTDPGTAFWLTIAGWVALITAVALVGPWRRHVLGPAGVVATTTVLVLVADALTGSTLVVDSPMGAHSIMAARFYGMSNQAFALLTAGGLLVAVVTADLLLRRGRRAAAVAAVAAIGLVITVVDGAPGLGSDFGGPPALIIAFTMLALAVSGRKVSWRAVLVVTGVVVVVAAGFLVLDWSRPPGERTHLGRFLATALDGGLWEVVHRKLSVNLRVLTSWRYLVLAVGGALLTALVVAGPAIRRRLRPWRGRPRRPAPLEGLETALPLLRPAVAAIGVGLAIGFAVNDSGIVVPATGIALAVPCLVAAAAGWRITHDGALPADAPHTRLVVEAEPPGQGRPDAGLRRDQRPDDDRFSRASSAGPGGDPPSPPPPAHGGR